MSICLLLFALLSSFTYVGGGRFIKELRPSPLEQTAKSGDGIIVAGSVYKKESRSDYQILYLKHNSIYYQQRVLQESKLIVYDKTKSEIQIGNKVKAEGELAFMASARNPGNFDEKSYYQRQDIHAKVWGQKLEVVKSSVNFIPDTLSQLREGWKLLIYDAIGEENGAVLTAMMLGDKADMNQDLKSLYQQNGIGHILAISGLHLSFIGVGMYHILRRATGSFAIGGTAGILFLLCYIIMIGLTVSAMRALVMFLFRVGADMAGRHYDAPTAFATALVITVIWRPLYIFDGGFWLSFGAVAGVLIVVPLFGKEKLQGLWASIGIQAVILPILLYFFYEFPLYSALLNVFIIPLMSVLLFLGLAGSALSMLVPGVGTLFLVGCKWIIEIYNWSCRLAIKLPLARIITGCPKLWQLALYFTILLILVISLRGKKTSLGRNMVVSGALFLLAILVLVIPQKLLMKEKTTITMLDVGQGDGVLVQSGAGNTYFFDGGSSDVKSVGTFRIEPFLKYQGIGSIDYVFLSHGDGDHTSGIEEMISKKEQSIQIKNLIMPPQHVWDENLIQIAKNAKAMGVSIYTIEQGKVLGDKDLRITCIEPDANYGGEIGNASSLVLALQVDDFDMLLTGDVEGQGEDNLTETLLELDKNRSWDVLKVAHHGSKNSTSKKFVDCVKPKYGLISAGVHNRYGHPHQETVERLKEAGCTVYSTQECGAITIHTDGKAMQMKSYLPH